MLHPSTKKLIDRLGEMTAQRKIDWVPTDRPDALVYDTEGYRVILEGVPAALVLCDALGNELDRADPDELAQTKHIDGGTYTEIVEDMRKDASRIARGTESAIAILLDGLDPDNLANAKLDTAEEETENEAGDGAVEDMVNEADIIEVDEVEALEAALEADVESDDFEEEIDVAAQEAGFDEHPDVGQAVADLADRVNGDPVELAGEEASATEEPGANGNSSAKNLLMGGGLLGAVGAAGSFSRGTIETRASQPVETNAAEQSDEATETVEAPETVEAIANVVQGEVVQEDVPAETTAEPAPTDAPDVGLDAPITSISLSGLAEPDHKISFGDAVVPAPEEMGDALSEEASRAATIVAELPEVAPQENIEERISSIAKEITSSSVEEVPEMAQELAAPEIAPDDIPQVDKVPQLDDIAAPEAPDAPAEETEEARPKPKRFNPWI